MNRRTRITVALATLAFALSPLAALAAKPVDIVPAKLRVKGTATAPIVGKGRVVVQVLVHPDGSHQAMRVIRSSNPADNQAAMQIAQSSTYRPATRNGKPTVWFYDYTLVFNGVGVTADTGGSGGGNDAVSRIQRMVRVGNYAGAKALATSYLLAHPDDSKARTQLGVADFFSNDYAGSAAAFSRAGNVDTRYKQVAAHAFSAAAVNLAATDPATAIGYGQKAVSLDPGANSQVALGFAQLTANDSASAVVTLKKAHDLAFADKTTDTKSKIIVDTALLKAYAAQNDTAGTATTCTEIGQLDPTSTVCKRIIGDQYLTAAFAALTANDEPTAMKNFDLAIANGDTDVQVTANAQAALALTNDKKPDATKVKAYADQALALGPNSPLANFAEGVALTLQYASDHKAETKAAALAACNKAEALAKAQSDNATLFKIEAFVKSDLS